MFITLFFPSRPSQAAQIPAQTIVKMEDFVKSKAQNQTPTVFVKTAGLERNVKEKLRHVTCTVPTVEHAFSKTVPKNRIVNASKATMDIAVKIQTTKLLSGKVPVRRNSRSFLLLQQLLLHCCFVVELLYISC